MKLICNVELLYALSMEDYFSGVSAAVGLWPKSSKKTWQHLEYQARSSDIKKSLRTIHFRVPKYLSEQHHAHSACSSITQPPELQ